MKLQNLLISVLVSGCLVGCAVCNLLGCVRPACDKNELSIESLQKEFLRINEVLTESTTSTDAEQNMKIVEDVLRKAESISLIELKKKKKKKKKLARAAKLFLSLRELESTSKCNKDGLDILDGVLISLDSQQIPQRLGEIILHYLKQQDLVCSAIYPGLLAERLASKDKLKLDRLDQLFERSVHADKWSQNRVDILWKEIKAKNIGESRNLQDALDYFYKTQPLARDIKTLDDNEALKKEIRLKYLIEPCRHFTQNLEDIYEVASNWIYVHNPDNKQFDFYYNWAKYMFCEYANKNYDYVYQS